jgi:hypothetical protein
MSIEDTLERFHQATVVLCREGAIKDRLADAYAMHLAHIDIEHVPAELRAEFEALRAAMNRALPLPRESVVRASVRKMSNDEASRHAVQVVHLYAGVAREQRPVRAPRRASRTLRRVANVSPLVSPNVSPIVKLFAKEN